MGVEILLKKMNEYKIKKELLNDIIKDLRFEVKGLDDKLKKAHYNEMIRVLQIWKEIIKE
jgi:hypothetical protein